MTSLTSHVIVWSVSKSYSTYEAKARFSEVIRLARGGQAVTITWHGKPVAEVRPISDLSTLDERLARLEERGQLIPARASPSFVPVVRRPGALDRFLADRD